MLLTSPPLFAGAHRFITLKDTLKSQGLNTGVMTRAALLQILSPTRSHLSFFPQLRLLALSLARTSALLRTQHLLSSITRRLASMTFHKEGQFPLPPRKRRLTTRKWSRSSQSSPSRTSCRGDDTGVLTQRLGKKIQLVGDDLFVTNTSA